MKVVRANPAKPSGAASARWALNDGAGEIVGAAVYVEICAMTVLPEDGAPPEDP